MCNCSFRVDGHTLLQKTDFYHVEFDAAGRPIEVPDTEYLAIHVTFHGNVVNLEDAYQNLDNQPLTQIPCVSEETAPGRGPRSRCRPSTSVLRDARSSARAAHTRDP
jgi:hypothetical protein